MQSPKGMVGRKDDAARDMNVPAVVFDLMSREMLEYFISKPELTLEKKREALENFGFQCGFKILLLVSKSHKILFKESIENIKHLAFDIWQYAFRANIEKVKTEYAGKQDLYISRFEWISILSNYDLKSPEYQEKIALYLRFICGVLRGSLSAMGLESIVDAEQRPDAYIFSINLNKAKQCFL